MHLRLLQFLAALTAAAVCRDAAAATPSWVIEGFDAFRRGSFGNAGQNLYVSRAGVLQRIHRYDLDGDGHFDLPFANCQEHHESAPSFVYALDGTRLATLPGQGALSGTVADFDGDGLQDVAIAGHHDMVSPFAAADIYFGRPDGVWDERFHVRLQSPRATDCASGVFDASGRRALVFAIPRWSIVRVYSQGDAGFEWNGYADLPLKADAIAAGDFDGDGFDDLACRIDATGATTVLWGGAEGLDTARATEVPPPDAGAYLGLEIKAGLKSEMEEECPPLRLCNALRLGGRTCFTLSTGKKLVFFEADASRRVSRALELDAPMAMAAASGDFDGDGFDDLAIAARATDVQSPSSQTSFIWFGAAEGFLPENRLAVHTRSACCADALDSMVLFGQNAADGFFTNDALLYEFGAARVAPTARPPRLPEPRRFRGEDTRRAFLFRTPGGEARVALVSHHARRSDGYDRVFIYTGGEDGFSPDRKTEVPGWCAVDTVAADLDDDGRAELLVCNDSENAFHKDPGLLLHQFGPDGYETGRSEALPVDIGWGAVVADFDHDGLLEIISVADHWNSLAVFHQDGTGAWRRARDIALFPPDPARVRHNVEGSALTRPDASPLRWIATADLDGDGWLDLALPTTGAHSLVLRGGADGFDPARRQEFAATFCAGVRVADLDRDGRPELIFGGHTRQASGDGNAPVRQPHHSFLHIYWNGPDGFAESRKCELRADAASHFCMGDFNGDGWLDIFACSYQGEIDRDINSFIYWNREGRFSNFDRQDLVTHAASGCIAADFDEDGRIDLAVANHKIFGDHLGYSEVWWNGPDGFLPTRTTKLPTRGPHGIVSPEPGNVLTRGPEEFWFSEPRRLDGAAVVDRVEVTADCPPKTWVKATARAAATREELASAEWREPAGLEVPQGGFLQIRLALGATNSLSSPRVSRVETHFAAGGASVERAVTRGSNPVFSPDGSRIAFQRLEGGVFKLGVIAMTERCGELSERANGGASPPGEPPIEWIEDGPGNAAYPVWTPAGALIYTYGHDAETAHEAWKSGSESGYGLRICEPNGTKRDLTRGRCRDYTPCVSPDGRHVYFVTTRGVESASKSFSQAAATQMAVVSLPQSPQGEISHRDTEAQRGSLFDEPIIVRDAPNGNNSGYEQPAVSPDGALMVWGQLDSFFDTWRIYGARLAPGSPPAFPEPRPVGAALQAAPCRLTPSSLAALSPRWHPFESIICFTGFRAGDPGWGVWVEDIRTGKVRRLATGENPCFSPDGATIAYDRGGTVFVSPFGPCDFPDETLPDIREEDAPERVLWKLDGATGEKTIDISSGSIAGAASRVPAKTPEFAFGDDKAAFIRATLRPGDGAAARTFLTAAYAEHPRALQLYASGGQIWFVSFDHAGKFFASKAPLPSGSNEISVVAARTPTRLLLSVNGAPPAVTFTGGALPLDTPRRIAIGADVASLEIGTGWPVELPKTPTREALFP